MKIVSLIFQIVVALGLLNVWILRFHKSTAFRGGNARTMPEEFEAYGLPKWFLWIIGGLKVLCAVGLLVGLWMPVVVRPAAGIIALLMIGALAMHVRIRDPFVKSLPAGIILTLVTVVLINAL